MQNTKNPYLMINAEASNLPLNSSTLLCLYIIYMYKVRWEVTIVKAE